MARCEVRLLTFLEWATKAVNYHTDPTFIIGGCDKKVNLSNLQSGFWHDKDDLSLLEKQELLLRRGKIPTGPRIETFAFAGSVKILSDSSGREADGEDILIA